MPKSVPALTVKEIERNLAAIAAAGKPVTFAVGGVDGLSIRWRNTKNCCWLLRIRKDGEEKRLVLGPYKSLALKAARAKAEEILENGGKRPETSNPPPEDTPKTVADLWPAFVQSMIEAGEWKDARSLAVKMNFGANHVFPILGLLTPDQVTFQHVAAVLNAQCSKSGQDKALTIVRQFLRWCLPRGYRKNEILPTDRGTLKTLYKDLSESGGNMPALDWRDVPRFVAKLTDGGLRGIGSIALLFKILTASRSEPIHKAEWAEVSEDFSQWVCPPEHMKVKRNKDGSKAAAHVVPLSTQAQALLRVVRGYGRTSGLIFGMGVHGREMELGRGRGISNLDKKARITRPAPLI